MFTLSQALEALNGHTEFTVKRYDGVVSIDYIVIFPGSFDATEQEIRERAYYLWDNAGRPAGDEVDFWLQAEQDCRRFATIRRNFRGVTFDEQTGEIVSLPLHKFFNVNQTPETSFEKIKHRTATIYEKLDGSMIHFFIHPQRQELQASTCRSSLTPQAQEALKLAHKQGLKGVLEKSILDGWTPIFEYVAPNNQIVVAYPKPRLVYLISRNRHTGEYRYDWKAYPDKAQSYEFTFGDIFSQVNREEFEGYVCHLHMDDGKVMLVKAKTPWYMERHRAVDALMRPAYKLYGVVFQGVMDDLIALAADRFKPALTAIYEEAQRDLLNERLRLEAEFADLTEKLDSEPVVAPPDKYAQLEEQVDSLKRAGKKIEAIKRFQEATGLGLIAARDYVKAGIWPHGLVRQDEIDLELSRQSRRKTRFVELVQQMFPRDFNLLMTMYAGRDPGDGIKERLMEKYREKYPNKLFADLEEDSTADPGDGTESECVAAL
jgi:T4 RnlA family RNA ligase